MYRAVLPKPSAFEHWLLTGNADRSADGWHREEALVEDAVVETTDYDGPDDTDGVASAAAPPPGL
jgi:hypothetical protein